MPHIHTHSNSPRTHLLKWFLLHSGLAQWPTVILRTSRGFPAKIAIGLSSQYPIAPPSTPSEKLFGSHYIVHALLPGMQGDSYFDPSYGVTYTDAAAFQSKAVAGFAVGDPHDNLPQGFTHLVVRQAGPINITLTDAAPGAAALESPPDGATGVVDPAELRWLPTSGFVGYYILELSTNASFPTASTLRGEIAGTVLPVPGLAPNTQYYWRVTAINCLGARTSSVRSFRTAP